MVSNPMQKKARNSFLLGMVITLIVCIIIGVLFYFLVMKQEEVKQEEEGVLTYAYRLNTNVQAGQTITSSMVEPIIVTEKAVPAGAFASKTKTTDNRGRETWVDKAFPSDVYKSKVALNSGTILSNDLVYEGEDITNDLRYVEYNMLILPTTIVVGDYVDIRITLPNGQDLIVVSKKEVKSIIGDTIGLELTEGEIVMMESAIVESYIMISSKIYAIQYVEPGIQTAAEKTYTPTAAVVGLIERNGNIVNEAKSALKDKFNADVRTWTDIERMTYTEDQQENLEEGIQEEIENARAAREAYLAGLTSY